MRPRCWPRCARPVDQRPREQRVDADAGTDPGPLPIVQGPSRLSVIGGAVMSSNNVSPKEQAELEQAAADFDRAMDALYDAEATLDLLQTVWTANAKNVELGTDHVGTPINALRALQRHLQRAREAMEHGAG